MNEVPQPKKFNSKKYIDNYSQIDWSNKKDNFITSDYPECANCKEKALECACLRNKCVKCGGIVGNITFTVCDECFEKNK